jgi:hypothetical protein
MLTVNEYTVRLSGLLHREHEALAEFLVELAEFDRRCLWREAGYGTLFDYLHRELGLSRGAAHYRRVAAELVRSYPEVLEPIRDGRLCFSSVLELAKVISPENRAEVLPRFFYRSKAESKVVAAEIRPVDAPPRRDVVTAVRAAPRAVPAPAAPAPTPLPFDGEQIVHPMNSTSPQPPSPCAERPELEPLTADLARLHATVSKGFLEKLDRARDALSHSNPGASIAEILEAGLDLLLERDAKRKGFVAKPQKNPRPTTTDRIPASVRRAVFLRDGFKCQYRLPNGEICGATHQLEIDHLRPRALGGPSTLENCRAACKPHNGLAAREVFGDAWMDRFKRRRASADRSPPPPPPAAADPDPP